MKLSAPQRILFEMLLAEQDIAFEDGMLVVKLNDNQYYLDDESGNWVSFDGIVAGTKAKQDLDSIAATDDQAQRAVNAARVGQPIGGHGRVRGRTRGIQQVAGDGEEFDEQWYVDYRAKLDDWGPRGLLKALPGPIAARFSGYWMQFDTGKDFVAIVPTNFVMKGSRSSSGGFKGFYVFRKNAHKESAYVREGEDWSSYLPKLDPEKRGLLDIRKNAVALNLGRYLRRDFHTKNITINLEQFDSYDELIANTAKAESVEPAGSVIMTRSQYREVNLG